MWMYSLLNARQWLRRVTSTFFFLLRSGYVRFAWRRALMMSASPGTVEQAVQLTEQQLGTSELTIFSMLDPGDLLIFCGNPHMRCSVCDLGIRCWLFK
jgi:hypothetical protein